MMFRVAALTLAALVGAVAVAPLASAATASPAPAAPDYLRTAYDGTIFEVTDGDVVPLTFAEWSDRGFPAYRPAPTVFQKVLTFPTVTAITSFARAGVDLTADITWPEYQAAGYPAVRTAAWGSDISVHKWGTSPQLLAQDAAGDIISLTYAQWRAAGFPSFEAREGRGFVRLSWDATGGIAYLCSTATGQGGRLTYEQWRSLGSPTPYTVSRTANDTVWRIFGGAQLSYVGAMNLSYTPGGGLQPLSNRALSFSEWQAMGSPAPVDRIPEASVNLTCGQGAPSAWE
ncbi:hypothetical protein ACF044_12790 [Microbacterium sp. NPDC016588]